MAFFRLSFPPVLPSWAQILTFDVGNTIYTVNTSQYYLYVNTNGQDVTITLPSNAEASRAFNIRKINDSADTLTLITDDVDCLIDGNTGISTNSILTSFSVCMGLDGNYWSTGGGVGGGATDVDLTYYVNTDQLSANLSVYPLTTFLTGNYPNTVQLTANLGNYPNNSQLTDNLAPYATNTYLNTNFPNNAQLSSNIANFITGAQLSGNLTVYVNTAQLSSNLGNYPNTTQLSDNLANYATNTYLTTNYPNNSQLSSNLSVYVNASQLSGNLALYTNTLNLSTNYPNTTQLTNNLANYPNTTQLTNNLANYTNTLNLSTNYPNTTQLTNNLANYPLTSFVTGNYPNNTQLTNNLANYQITAGLNANIDAYLPNYTGVMNASSFKIASNLSVNSSVLFFANSSANVIVVNNYISGNGYGLTSIQVGALQVFNASVNGIVTNSGGGTTNYLRADGTWTVPSFAVVAAGNTNQIQYNVSNSLAADANFFYEVATTKLTLGNSTVNAVHTPTSIVIGNATVNVTMNSSTFSGTALTANNATNLGGTAASGYQTTAGLSANVATLTANNANYLGTVAAASYQQTGAPLVNNVATMSANNASYLGTVAAASYQQIGAPLVNNVATMSANNSSYLGTVAAASYINTSGSYVITGFHTYGNLTINVVVTNTSVAIGAINTTAVGLLLSNNLITLGNSSVNATINSTTFSGISLTANNATNLGGTAASGYQTTAGLSSNVAGLTANNSNYLGTVAAASYLTNTGAYTISGVHTHTANLVFGTGAALSANGTIGTANQVLTSNGTIPYWASLASGMISGLAASATTDTTNATNISSGTLGNARLPANILTTNTADQTITGGANITCANLGIKSSGTTTIDCGTCPLQVLTNNGAFTFAAPASDGSCVVLVYNGTAANTITFSGFSGGSAGDAINYTSGNKFMIHVLRITSNATYNVKALQ